MIWGEKKPRKKVRAKQRASLELDWVLQKKNIYILNDSITAVLGNNLYSRHVNIDRVHYLQINETDQLLTFLISSFDRYKAVKCCILLDLVLV